MRVSFHGVRGSHSVCGARYLKFGGCTASVSVEAAGWRILLDLGTGLIAPGKIWTNGASGGAAPARPLVALVSHPHHDHLAGFAFFKPAYRAGWKLELYGPKLRGLEFGEIIVFHPDGKGGSKPVARIRAESWPGLASAKSVSK